MYVLKTYYTPYLFSTVQDKPPHHDSFLLYDFPPKFGSDIFE